MAATPKEARAFWQARAEQPANRRRWADEASESDSESPGETGGTEEAGLRAQVSALTRRLAALEERMAATEHSAARRVHTCEAAVQTDGIVSYVAEGSRGVAASTGVATSSSAMPTRFGVRARARGS